MSLPNIVLVGFTSCGKSATARSLATITGKKLIDLDYFIEKKFFRTTGVSLRCREIFNEHGAEAFAKIEHESLCDLATRKNYILSTGGGAPMKESNRPIIKSIGVVVHLDPDPAVIVGRLKNKGYPAYLGPDPNPEKLMNFWEIRNPVYREIADISIDNTDITAFETAQQIVDLIQKQGVEHVE